MENQNDEFANSVSFRAACAVEHDYIYVAAYMDAHDPRETEFTRLYAYAGRLVGDKWYHQDLHISVVSVCVKKATPTDGRRLCSLSKDGEVELYSNIDGSSIVEQIVGAGLKSGTRGALQAIREIGTSLYACGVNNQVYKRLNQGNWILLNDSHLKLRTSLKERPTMLSSIDGTSDTDVYACGLSGQLYHYNGIGWSRLSLPTDEHLNCVRCVAENEVLVCGNNGTLLIGSASHGFKNVSTIDDNQQFWSLTKFKGVIYLATLDEGLFAYDGSTIAPVETGFASGLWTYELDSVPETLWSFSPKEIAYFDGAVWTRVQHPENEEVID